jgi:hypothetical protein
LKTIDFGNKEYPMQRLLMSAFVLMIVATVTRADDPLPPPRVVESFIIQPIYRRSAYEVWQNYGVDRSGFFKPLVVYSPYGSYYRYNGAPFPWTTTHQREFMPYVVD